MKPTTIVVFRTETGFESIKEFADSFRLPVTGFSVRDAEGGGMAMFDLEKFSADDREYVATNLFDCYRMVAAPQSTAGATVLSIVRDRIRGIREALAEVERQLQIHSGTEQSDLELENAVIQLSHQAEQTEFELYSHAAETPPDDVLVPIPREPSNQNGVGAHRAPKNRFQW